MDVLTGLHAATAVAAALRTGEGAHIEVPLIDSALASLVNVAQGALVTGAEPGRHGNAHPSIVPYQDFPTATGRIAVAAPNDGLFARLCAAVGREELASDARFASNADRVENREALQALLDEAFAARPGEEWVERLGRAGVPAGEVRSVPGALDAVAAAGRPATERVSHPTAGQVDLVASPIRTGSRRARPRPRRCWGSTPSRCSPSWDASATRSSELAAQGVIGLPGAASGDLAERLAKALAPARVHGLPAQFALGLGVGVAAELGGHARREAPGEPGARPTSEPAAASLPPAPRRRPAASRASPRARRRQTL